MPRYMHSIEISENVANLRAWGLSLKDIGVIRFSAARLHRWFELECGTDEGLIQQNEETGVWTMHRDTGQGYELEGYKIRDCEKLHRARLSRIMAKYPTLAAYIQTDPRGCPVYICRKEDARQDRYTSGCAVIV